MSTINDVVESIWKWVSKYTRVSGYTYGQKTAYGTHHGIDIGAAEGSTINSPYDGIVTYAGWNDQGYGNLVIVKSANGKFLTYLAHLSKVLVNVGDTVKMGNKVGEAGNTGNSYGAHLHLEVRKTGGGFINPACIWEWLAGKGDTPNPKCGQSASSYDPGDSSGSSSSGDTSSGDTSSGDTSSGDNQNVNYFTDATVSALRSLIRELWGLDTEGESSVSINERITNIVTRLIVGGIGVGLIIIVVKSSINDSGIIDETRQYLEDAATAREKVIQGGIDTVNIAGKNIKEGVM